MSADRSRHPIVHLVGSIPLPDAETVFRTVSGAVGRHLVRLPDGETGIRKTWIRFLQDVLAANPAIELASDVPPFKFVQWDGKVVREIPRLRVKPGATPDARSFKTGYADMAIESWGLFDRLQQGGVIPAKVKFQICMPTPIAPTYNNMVPSDRPRLAGADAALRRRGRDDRAGAARTTASRCNGTCARKCWRGRATTSRARSTSGSRRSTCSTKIGDAVPAADRARLSPVLRQPGRRAHGAAEGRRYHGRDRERDRRAESRARSSSFTCRCRRGAPTMPISRRSRTCSSAPRPSFISA